MHDREQFFKKDWKSVVLELEGSTVQVEVNVGKPSFWRPGCGELISREIRIWLKENGLGSWPRGNPLLFIVLNKQKRQDYLPLWVQVLLSTRLPTLIAR